MGMLRALNEILVMSPKCRLIVNTLKIHTDQEIAEDGPNGKGNVAVFACFRT